MIIKWNNNCWICFMVQWTRKPGICLQLNWTFEGQNGILLKFSHMYIYGLGAVECMSSPASQYSVLDAERIERVDDNTFKCYVYRLKFFALEVCLVLLVRVEEQPDVCCINLLFCKVCVYTLLTLLILH